ncbi:MAG: hypothetical protein JXB47_18050 [Anaerolineae bacterium]|nr:hypothetical protein [Anaerolineae bacterium]
MRFNYFRLLPVLALLVVGCAPTPTDTPQPEGITRIVLSKESVGLGDSTVVYMLTIDPAAGTFELETKDKDPAAGEISAGSVDELSALLDEVGFYEFDADYIPPDGSCCDLIYYTIAITKDGQTFSVRGSDSESPEGYLDVLVHIEAMASP